MTDDIHITCTTTITDYSDGSFARAELQDGNMRVQLFRDGDLLAELTVVLDSDCGMHTALFWCKEPRCQAGGAAATERQALELTARHVPLRARRTFGRLFSLLPEYMRRGD